jgi:hypothetical protein
MWVASLFANPAVLQVSVNDIALVGSPFTAPTPTAVWTKFVASWQSGTSTTAVLSIVDQNLAAQGNDFALDDISLKPSTGIVFLPPSVVEAVAGTPIDYKTGFIDSDPSASVSSYTATIDWGDGSASPATISSVFCPLPGKCFAITGNHEYASGGVFPVRVDVTKLSTGSKATTLSYAEVSDSGDLMDLLDSPPVGPLSWKAQDRKDGSFENCTGTLLAYTNIVVTAKHCFFINNVSEVVVPNPPHFEFAPNHQTAGRNCYQKAVSECGESPLGLITSDNAKVVYAPETDVAFVVMARPTCFSPGLAPGLVIQPNCLDTFDGLPQLPITFNRPKAPFGWLAVGYPVRTDNWTRVWCFGFPGSSAVPHSIEMAPCQGAGGAGTSGGPWGTLTAGLVPGVGAVQFGGCGSRPDCWLGDYFDASVMALYIQALNVERGS